MRQVLFHFIFFLRKSGESFALSDEAADPAGFDDEVSGPIFYDSFCGNGDFFLNPMIRDFYFPSLIRNVLADGRGRDAEFFRCLALAEPEVLNHPLRDFFSYHWYPIPNHIFAGSAPHR